MLCSMLGNDVSERASLLGRLPGMGERSLRLVLRYEPLLGRGRVWAVLKSSRCQKQKWAVGAFMTLADPPKLSTRVMHTAKSHHWEVGCELEGLQPASPEVLHHLTFCASAEVSRHLPWNPMAEKKKKNGGTISLMFSAFEESMPLLMSTMSCLSPHQQSP